MPAQCAHQHLAARGVGVGQGHPGVAQDQLAHLVRMRRATGLDDRHAPVALSGLHQVIEVDPGVRERGYLQWRAALGAAGQFVEQAGAQQRDAVGLRPVDQPLHHAVRRQFIAGFGPGVDRVDHQAAGAMLLGERLDAPQVDLRAAGDGAGRDHMQAAVLHVGIEPDAYRGQVADHLGIFRIETDKQGALAAPAGRLRERTAQGRLGGAGGAGDQHAGATVVAAAEHGVEPLHAAGNALVADFCVHAARCPRDGYLKPAFADQERRFILVEAGAAILLHAQIALRHALHHAVVEDHGAVHHVLHEAERLLADSTRFIPASLQADEAGQSASQQPFVQPMDLPPFRGCVGQQRQYDIQGIEHDALRPHFLGLGRQRRQHPAQIEIARLQQVGHRLGVNEKQLFVSLQSRKVPAETLGVGLDPPRGLLKSDEDARLLAIPRAMDQELQRQYGLAGAGPAHQQRGAAARQTAAGDFVESGDAGRRLVWYLRDTKLRGFHGIFLKHARGRA
nr:C65 [uncultured bacterium]